MQFWKIPSRRVYAVKGEDIQRKENDRKRQRSEDCSNALGDLKEEVKVLKLKIDNVQATLTSSANLKEKVREFLKCTICLDTPTKGSSYVSCFLLLMNQICFNEFSI